MFSEGLTYLWQSYGGLVCLSSWVIHNSIGGGWDEKIQLVRSLAQITVTAPRSLADCDRRRYIKLDLRAPDVVFVVVVLVFARTGGGR